MTQKYPVSLMLTRGLQASGKSTYAQQVIEQNPKIKRVNRDLLRQMFDFGKYTEAREKLIRKAELALAKLLLSEGYAVIVDDTNLSESAMTMWQQFAQEQQVELTIKDFTDVDIEECITRDRKRPNYVGEKVIRDTYYRYLYKPVLPPLRDPLLPDALIVDCDGTLAIHNGRSPYEEEKCEMDLPNQPVIDIVLRYQQSGHKILVTSGRKEKSRAMTLNWLNRQGIIPAQLLMRPDGDPRRDDLVKRELYENHIQGNYNVLLALDDRARVVRVWRSLGIPTFQVAEGDF